MMLWSLLTSLIVPAAGLAMPTALSRGGTARMVVARHANGDAPTALSRGRTACMVVSRRDNGNEQVSTMPADLAEWGCDEELWSALRAGGRSSLKKLLRDGRQELCRERIDKLRVSVQQGPEDAPKRRLRGGYVLSGVTPEGFDVRAAEALIEARTDAKHAKEFETADALESQLLALGVILNDKHGSRSWCVESAAEAAAEAALEEAADSALRQATEATASDAFLADAERAAAARRCRDGPTASDLFLAEAEKAAAKAASVAAEVAAELEAASSAVEDFEAEAVLAATLALEEARADEEEAVLVLEAPYATVPAGDDAAGPEAEPSVSDAASASAGPGGASAPSGFEWGATF